MPSVFEAIMSGQQNRNKLLNDQMTRSGQQLEQDFYSQSMDTRLAKMEEDLRLSRSNANVAEKTEDYSISKAQYESDNMKAQSEILGIEGEILGKTKDDKVAQEGLKTKQASANIKDTESTIRYKGAMTEGTQADTEFKNKTMDERVAGVGIENDLKVAQTNATNMKAVSDQQKAELDMRDKTKLQLAEQKLQSGNIAETIQRSFKEGNLKQAEDLKQMLKPYIQARLPEGVEMESLTPEQMDTQLNQIVAEAQAAKATIKPMTEAQQRELQIQQQNADREAKSLAQKNDPLVQQSLAAAKAKGSEQGKFYQEKVNTAPQIVSSVRDYRREIKAILDHPALDDMLVNNGLNPSRLIAGTDAYDLDQRLKQLRGKIGMQAYDALRGAGHITEGEREQAERSIASITLLQSKKQFTSTLDYLDKLASNGEKKANAYIKADRASRFEVKNQILEAWDEAGPNQQNMMWREMPDWQRIMLMNSR